MLFCPAHWEHWVHSGPPGKIPSLISKWASVPGKSRISSVLSKKRVRRACLWISSYKHFSSGLSLVSPEVLLQSFLETKYSWSQMLTFRDLSGAKQLQDSNNSSHPTSPEVSFISFPCIRPLLSYLWWGLALQGATINQHKLFLHIVLSWLQPVPVELFVLKYICTIQFCFCSVDLCCLRFLVLLNNPPMVLLQEVTGALRSPNSMLMRNHHDFEMHCETRLAGMCMNSCWRQKHYSWKQAGMLRLNPKFPSC